MFTFTGEDIVREVKQLTWGHIAISQGCQNSNPGMPIPKPVILPTALCIHQDGGIRGDYFFCGGVIFIFFFLVF